MKSTSLTIDAETCGEAREANRSKLNAPVVNLEPSDFTGHLQELVQREEPMRHTDILTELLKRFEPLDFDELAYPERSELLRKARELRAKTIKQNPKTGEKMPNKDLSSEEVGRLRKEAEELEKKVEKMRAKQKEILILCIENLSKVAEELRWGLCKHQDFVYMYNGQFWQFIDRETFKKFLGEAAEAMGAAKFTARYYKFRDELLKQFDAAAYKPAPDFDPDAVQVNLMNGTYEIKGGKGGMRLFDPNDFITYQLPFNFDPDAKAKLWQAYLDRVLPDKSRQQVLAEYMGYVFIRNGSSRLKLEQALVLYGTGANGKSVFYEVMNALLGAENVSSYSLEHLTDTEGYSRAAIANKLVNYASEINGKLETAAFKQLVSGEPVQGRFPYGRPMILKNYAKLIFNCNELPREVEHTEAYFRRWLIVPFDVTIPNEERDSELPRKIISTELPAVFNWVLDGLNRLLEQKRFTECEAARDAVQQYRTEADSVQMFLSENGYQRCAEDIVEVKELYRCYKDYCREDLFIPLKKSNFKKRLEAAHVQVVRRNYGEVAFLSRISND
jgi:putative DNA primase/helicase